MGIRFVHAADFHLGSPLRAVGETAPHLEERLRDASYTAVERVFDVALDEDVDFVVVAGDLYDGDARSVRANEFLAAQFERLEAAGVPAYVCYGNHDPVGSARTYVDLPSNVHEFDDADAEVVCYPDEDAPAARVWGQSYRAPREERTMYYGFAAEDDGVPTAGVLHTAMDPDGTRYVPVSRADLEGKAGVDYWALGHRHHPQAYGDDPRIAYPGIPQGRHVGETGPGGCLLVELDGDAPPDVEFVPTSPIVWRERRVDVGGSDAATLPELRDVVEAAADELAAGTDAFDDTPVSVRDPDWDVEGYVCRWRLVGNGPAHETLGGDPEAVQSLAARLRETLGERSPFVWTEAVRDDTGPPVPDVEDLRESDRVVDEFLSLADELADDDGARAAFREAAGAAWTDVDDPEERRPDALAMTDERLDDLIARARRAVAEELALQRGA